MVPLRLKRLFGGLVGALARFVWGEPRCLRRWDHTWVPVCVPGEDLLEGVEALYFLHPAAGAPPWSGSLGLPRGRRLCPYCGREEVYLFCPPHHPDDTDCSGWYPCKFGVLEDDSQTPG